MKWNFLEEFITVNPFNRLFHGLTIPVGGWGNPATAGRAVSGGEHPRSKDA